jgi:hypothetical protein
MMHDRASVIRGTIDEIAVAGLDRRIRFGDSLNLSYHSSHLTGGAHSWNGRAGTQRSQNPVDEARLDVEGARRTREP